MSSTMIDRIAIVIYNEARLNRANKPSPPYENLEPSLKLYWCKVAKLVIQAMREPTEEMMAEAESEVIELATFAEKEDSPSYKAWQAMIDVALKEDN